MTEPAWYSVLPPVLSILLAIGSRQVILSLMAGIWMGHTLLSGFNPLKGLGAAIDGAVDVLTDAGDARILIFTLVIGALIATIEYSGGVRGFVRFLESRRWVHNGFRAQLLAWLTGLVIFIESNITLLVAGSVSRPLFDRYRVSREKLAYLIDSTSAPVCAMIPLNAWGAMIIGLVASTGLANPLQVFVSSIPYNLYAIAAILLAAVVIVKDINLGPMRKAEARTRSGELRWPDSTPPDMTVEDSADSGREPTPSAAFMTLPILAMLIMMPIGLYITGDGNFIEGSGSTSILWSVSFALAVAWAMILGTGKGTVNRLMNVFMSGAGSLLPIAAILLLALALGDVATLLGTGDYIAGLIGARIPPALLAPLVFLTAAFIAFSNGSCWGTFAIMIPIAISVAVTLDLSAPLFLGAAISGAIFGDHASPISDTTVVASLAAATDHIDHVRTQLPYALIGAALAATGFLAIGIMP